ncbi:hypothetical protein FCL47_08680 [Desulfopila sp. IMCC35006]|uniref:hypothetical protein n=1 Tax=Desulfopila sp. IMCC35006 TaxID=2569542 RepID=UPI0010AC7372|nr:hypothetical protein [Desulfopila sp. IMCC35006]TKB26479.1 hypothetical protein FCL47_08680 [Desulfopila sp. IMCC35006]
MLHKFWSTAPVRGLHPDDIKFVDSDNCLQWSLKEARQNASTFADEKSLHTKLHINLHPQPFVGNLDESFVYILFGNPGFVIPDYQDELSNAVHAAACAMNLRKAGQGFYPLLPGSAGTGAANYWNSRFKNLLLALTHFLDISIAAARKLVIQRVPLLEAGAYHSMKSPGEWCDSLPSSRVTRSYVHQVLLPKARKGEVLIFVWRRATFWGIPTGIRGVISRPPKKAQLKNITALEREEITQFLAQRVQCDS